MASFLAGSASVSIHAPAWGATLTRPPVLPVSSLFQSTRPRGARRQTLAFGKVASAVSIHAPAWGATFRYVFPLCNLGQFQSTRPRGARREIGGAFQGAPGFNPRARVGRDATRTGERPVLVWFQSTRPRGARRFLGLADGRFKVVSIHAPAWGATLFYRLPTRQGTVFQSTRPRGARPAGRRFALGLHQFQSTRPRGARLHRPRQRRRGRPGFNPRARVGRDVDALASTEMLLHVSIHAPAWGATGLAFFFHLALSSFNPRARVGRDS